MMVGEELALAVLGPGTNSTDFATRSFIGLGGDSIRAMRLAALAQEQLGVRIPVKTLLGDVPLASVLETAAHDAQPAEPAARDGSPGHDDGSATNAQRGMWLTEQVTGGSPYNLVFLCFVEQGWLDPATLEQAARDTTGRNEGLRTIFSERAGQIVREVLAEHAPDFSAATCRGAADDFDESVRRIAAQCGHQPFDVSAAPAVRFLLISHAGGRQAVVLTAHHMMLDGWAVGLLLREVFTRYDELRQGRRGMDDAPRCPGVPMRALLRHQESQRASGAWDRQARLWGTRTDGVPTILELPADRPRPSVQDPAGARIAVDLGPAASASLADRARALGITPFAFLLGAFGLTLSRWTAARKLLVGVPLTGRDAPELMDIVAYAGNLVPVRVDIDDDMTAAGFLRSVQASLLISIDAGGLPFEELVARLGIERSTGCHPLVQVCFGMHDQLIPERITTDSVQVRVEEGHGGGSQFDLALMIGRSDPSLAGYAEYATSVWTAAEADGFIADFRAAVEQLAVATSPAAAPGTVLEQVRCLSPGRLAVLDTINATRRDFPSASLDELFLNAADRWPAVVSVHDATAELTYRQLADAAAEQARLLRAAGVRPGDTVLIGVERSVAEAVAVLGTVFAGAAYVGIDLSQPPAHIAKIVARSGSAAALVGPAGAERMTPHGVRVVSTWEPAWSLGSGDIPHPAADPARLAYVAFTSGSTGEPKGVAVPHRAVIRLVHEADYLRLGPAERVLRLSPLAFDASTMELWGALLNGATLEVCPPGLLSPRELGAFLAERAVTVAWLTAGLFRLVEEFASDLLGSLRHLLTGGDVVPHEHVARALARNPGLVISNGYGPTENTTFTSVHSVTRPEDVDGPLPIGTPVPGTRVYVLDERGHRVPPGAVGELYAGGAGLADGYLGDETETARCFGQFSAEVPERLYRTGDLVRIDSHGRLRFFGRADNQVKIRGYRVELGAISDALTAYPGVHDALVMVTEGDSAGKRIMAAVIPEPGVTLTPVELRDALSVRLPSYMVPSLWAVVDHLPVTANGKVDRRALAALVVAAGGPGGRSRPAQTGAQGEAQTQAMTQALALFAEAIELASPDAVAGFDAESDFFMAGGNSLGVVRLIALVNERLGVSLRLRDFLLSPTPVGLHRLIEKAESAAKAGVLPPCRRRTRSRWSASPAACPARATPGSTGPCCGREPRASATSTAINWSPKEPIPSRCGIRISSRPGACWPGRTTSTGSSSGTAAPRRRPSIRSSGSSLSAPRPRLTTPASIRAGSAAGSACTPVRTR
jgi:amino acid adenylation domain-containing protein